MEVFYIIIGALAVCLIAAIIVAVKFHSMIADTAREYNSKLTNKKIELHDLQASYAEVKEALTQAAAENDSLVRDVSAKDAEILTLQHIIEEKDAEIAKLKEKAKSSSAKSTTKKAAKVVEPEIIAPEIIDVTVEKPKEKKTSKKTTTTTTKKSSKTTKKTTKK